MIYTCTLNPAIDYIIDMNALETNKTNRATNAYFRAGGKGINVSVVLNNFGIMSTAIGFLGDFTGEFIKNQLKGFPLIRQAFIDVDGTTRMNLKMNHGFKETEVNGKGPVISDEQFEALLDQIQELKEHDVLICSGSTCQGQHNAYQRIAELCDKQHIPFVMDIPGSDLLELIARKPLLIKPNLSELETYFDTKIKSMDEVISYGKNLIEMGAQHVLISMGAKGSLFIDKDVIYKSNLIHGHPINTTGAGDSMVAAFVSSYLEKKNPKEAYLQAVAAGSATVFEDGLATREQCSKYIKKIKIKEINV